MSVKFKQVSYKNFLSSGNIPIVIPLDTHGMTLIMGKNGSGKCLDPSTEIDVRIDDPEIEKIFEEFMKNR
jgi:hypothetical protein